MELLLLLFTFGLATIARAQFIAGNDESSPSYLCNKTFQDANATGLFTFNPRVNQGQQEDQPDNDSHFALDVQWGVAAYDNIGASNATAEISAWYNTGGANYSDNANLWYDVCVVTMASLDLNSYYRGVNDTGDCMATLDEECVNALEQQSIDFTVGLVGNPTPNPGSNLTAGSLSHVCYDIGNMMTESFPKECKKYFSNDTAKFYGTAMTTADTDEKGSFLYSGCTLTNEPDNTTFHYATGSVLFTSQFTEEEQTVLWANLTQIIVPVLTVFMPIADVEATTTITTVTSHMMCPHINNINDGSLEPYAAPEPTPVGQGSGGGLSGGAIAGIVIGVLAAVGIVLGAFWFFWFRKRRANKKSVFADGDQPPPAYTADSKLGEAPSSDMEQLPLTELSGAADNQLRPELPTQKSGPRVELAGDAAYKDEAGPPAELPAAVK